MGKIEIEPAFANTLLDKCQRAEHALALLIEGGEPGEELTEAHEAMGEFLVLLGRLQPECTRNREEKMNLIANRQREFRDRS
jgi:hypothetical protein